MLNNLLVNAAFSLDFFILRFFADDLTVAQYRMPYRVLGVALLLCPLLTNAVFPVIARYAEDDRSAFNRAYQRTLQVLLMAAFSITVATTILARDLVYFVAGSQEASSFIGASDTALVWRPALAASAMGVVMVAIHPVGTLPSLAAGLLVYLASLHLLGAFGTEERALARRVMGQ